MDETEAMEQIETIVLKWRNAEKDLGDAFFRIWDVLDETNPFSKNEQIVQMRRVVTEWINGMVSTKKAFTRILNILGSSTRIVQKWTN